MLTILFDDSSIRFFGGYTLKVKGIIDIKQPLFATVIGKTGSGKTTVLSAIAHMFGCPAFRAVEKVDTSKIEVSQNIAPQHVGIIRQNPEKNFLGNCVAEEIRLGTLIISRLSPDELEKQLKKYWVNNFDGNLDIFERHPRNISSGQQQVLAVLVQMLRQPDCLLADEPFARLSLKNTQRVLNILRDLSSTAFVIISTHEDALFTIKNSLEAGQHHKVVNYGECLEITQQHRPSATNVPQVVRSKIEAACIDWVSYQDEIKHSNKFIELPENTIRNISGIGKPLTLKPLDIDVFMGRGGKPSVSVHGLNLKQGINIIYGENGAGKTLVGRVIGGDITINPNFPFFNSKYARVSDCLLNPSVAGSGVAGGATLRELHLSYRTHFLSSNPDDILMTTETIEKEVRTVYKKEADSVKRIDILKSYGFDVSRQIDSLSFGEKKLVSFILLGCSYSLIVLDEIFVNLSNDLQMDLAAQILEKCHSGDWSVVVLTSNRPAATIDVLTRGLTRTRIASR